jgi:hypothetical protein
MISSSGNVPRDCWNICALPEKLPVTSAGRVLAARSWMLPVTEPSDTPGFRLNDSVTEGSSW